MPNRQTGDSIPASDHNSLALALKAQGIANDDAGKLILAASLDVPFAIVSSIGSVQTKGVGASTAYTVPSGKLLYVRTITVTATGAVTLTPNGGSVFTTTGSASSVDAARTGLCLGAGDTITTPAGVYALGVFGDLPSAPSAPTRILQEINNSTTYTVPAGKALLLTHAYPSTSTSLIVLTVDGVSAFSRTAIYASANHYGDWPPMYLAAGQVLAVATANNFTISGLLFSV